MPPSIAPKDILPGLGFDLLAVPALERRAAGLLAQAARVGNGPDRDLLLAEAETRGYERKLILDRYHLDGNASYSLTI